MPSRLLYHATCRSNLASIAEGGLRPGTCLADSMDLADYYAETVADEGGDPVVVVIDAEGLGRGDFGPDLPSVEEPIMSVVRIRHGLEPGVGEEWVWTRWSAGQQTAEDCLRIVGAVRSLVPIPSERLVVDGMPLAEVASRHPGGQDTAGPDVGPAASGR
jgi:hypothetical protein